MAGFSKRFAAIGAAVVALASPALADAPRSILVMDGSGSMWGQIEGRAKLEIARDTVAAVLGGLTPDQELGLIAYGHREKGNCGDIELIVPPAVGTGAEIAAQVGKMRFLGKTPLSGAVRQAAEALRFGEAAATVVLVTDGLETCDADPCALGRELEAAGLNVTAHVIGFGLSGAEGAQVACLASETGGRYWQAKDAAALADALAATVTQAGQLPPPEPAPEPEPEPVLPKASLNAPHSAPAGSLLRVAFEGPHEEHDYIRILDADGTWRAETAVEAAPFVDLRLPFTEGAFELVYLFKAHDIIARLPVTLTPSTVSITAPQRAQAGRDVTITWAGPDAGYDTIQLYQQVDNERISYGYVKDQTEMTFTMPEELGLYEFRYVFQDTEEIFSRPITVTKEMVEAGPLGGPEGVPDQAAQTPAPLAVTYPVTLSVPAEFAGQPMMWSAIPLDPHPDAPEALSLPEAALGPWLADLTLGRWRITAEAALAGAGSGSGSSFGADITVTQAAGQAAGQAFEIPHTPYETLGMGEDAPSSSAPTSHFGAFATSSYFGAFAPVPLWIKGEYDGLLIRWQATPVSGQDSGQLGSDLQPRGWQTAFDPGRWLVEGFAEGGVGNDGGNDGGSALYAAVIDVTPEMAHGGAAAITLARTASMAADPLTLPNGEMAAAQCRGAVACSHTDRLGGLRYNLLPDWAASAALFLETAGGAKASAASVEFYSGAPLQVMAALNPRQWDAGLGPCFETALGPLCAAKEADPAATALLRSSLRATAPQPQTAPQPAIKPAIQPVILGTKLDLTPEAAAALRRAVCLPPCAQN